MNLFEFCPQKNIKRLALTTGLLIFGALLLMLLTMVLQDMAYRWAIQLLSLGMLAMGIFITTRYVMRSYVYAVMRTDDGDDLTVTELHGRHTVTVCRVSMDNVAYALVVPMGDREAEADVKNRIKADKRKVYNYCADLFGEKYICLFVREGGEAIAIKLSWDESLEKLFENKSDDTESDGESQDQNF